VVANLNLGVDNDTCDLTSVTNSAINNINTNGED